MHNSRQKENDFPRQYIIQQQGEITDSVQRRFILAFYQGQISGKVQTVTVLSSYISVKYIINTYVAYSFVLIVARPPR